MKGLQPLPGLHFTCNTTSLSMMGGTSHCRALPTPCEDEGSPQSLAGYAQSLQLRSNSPMYRAPSCFDPFCMQTCDRLTANRSKLLFAPMENASPSYQPHHGVFPSSVLHQDGGNYRYCAPTGANMEVSASTSAPVHSLDIINIQSCNTVGTENQHILEVSPRSLQTPRSNASRPLVQNDAPFPSTFSSPPARAQGTCTACISERSPSYTPTCKTPEQYACQQRGIEDSRLCAPYRSSPLPSRIEGIRRFDCANSSDEDDDDDEQCNHHQRLFAKGILHGVDSFGERARPFPHLMPPPLLQRLSPPERRSSDGGSSGAGRLVCNLAERFNNTQIYDALNSSP